jgi:hypothetical protein
VRAVLQRVGRPDPYIVLGAVGEGVVDVEIRPFEHRDERIEPAVEGVLGVVDGPAEPLRDRARRHLGHVVQDEGEPL